MLREDHTVTISRSGDSLNVKCKSPVDEANTWCDFTEWKKELPEAIKKAVLLCKSKCSWCDKPHTVILLGQPLCTQCKKDHYENFNN